MKSGICPKCGSYEVHAGTEITLKHGPDSCNMIPIAFMKSVALDNYVCAECGYVESYISDPKALKSIKEKWPRVIDNRR